MNLIRIELDPLKRETMKALTNPNVFHGAIASAQADRTKRILWRVDSVNGKEYLLILSQDPLEADSLVRQFGYPDEEAQMKNYDPFLEQIKNGSRWIFRLAANPVHSLNVQNKSEGRGKVVSHVGNTHQMEWLADKAEKNGFSVEPQQYRIVYSGWVQFWKKSEKRKVTFQKTIYEGILTVTDAERFKAALVNGIGREKAYGLGMMTVIPDHG